MRYPSINQTKEAKIENPSVKHGGPSQREKGAPPVAAASISHRSTRCTTKRTQRGATRPAHAHTTRPSRPRSSHGNGGSIKSCCCRFRQQWARGPSAAPPRRGAPGEWSRARTGSRGTHRLRQQHRGMIPIKPRSDCRQCSNLDASQPRQVAKLGEAGKGSGASVQRDCIPPEPLQPFS